MKLKHNEKSWNDLKKAGALMRLSKYALTSAFVAMDDCFRKKDYERKLNTAIRLISEVCCMADDEAVRVFPDRVDDATDLFYGAIDIEPRNETDKEIIEIAKSFVKGERQ